MNLQQAFVLFLVMPLAWPTAAGADGAQQHSSDRPPNIVLIMSDDMGFSDIGCYGGEIATPHLDRLAAGGLRFTQFYNTGRCCPTRASLLTGLYPHQAGMGHMTAAYSRRVQPGYTGDLNDRCQTIAEALRPAGYSTYMVGKWHVTSHEDRKAPKHNWPCQRGFDRFYGTIKGGGSYYDPAALCRDNTYITPDNDEHYDPETFYYTDAIADNGRNFIEDHLRDAPARPFFLYVSFTAAHWPMHALPEDIARYRGRYAEGYGAIRQARFERQKQLGVIQPGWDLSPQSGNWNAVPDKAWEERCMEVYAAMVDRMDQKIGELVDSLEAAGQLDNTLLLFLQDNGGCAEALGRDPQQRTYTTEFQPMAPDQLQPRVAPPMQTRDGRPVRQGRGVMPGPADTYIAYGRDWANVSNTPFREYKHWVHEGGISTPLVVHWPRGMDAANGGRLVHDPAHLIDIMATCLDVARVAHPAEASDKLQPLVGVSLRPTFEGQQLNRPQPLFWEHEGNCAVREGKWKLVRYNNGKLPILADWELYDIDADRTEMHNLATQHPEQVARLAEKWMAWAHSANVLPWPWDHDGQAFNRDQRLFRLAPRDKLPRKRAPYVAGVPFTVRVTLDGPVADGVLVAQGGKTNGWSLYVEQRRPTLSLRVAGRHSIAVADAPVSSDVQAITASIGAAGELEISVGEQTLAVAKAPLGLSKMPIDGLQVGKDSGGRVGNYGDSNDYQGQIHEVVITIQGK